MINFKREYIGLEKDRILYPISFKDKSRCDVYGRKKFVTVAGKEEVSAHAFLISKDFWTFNAGQLDFTNYANGVWNDYISIVIVEKGEYTAPSINFASMGDITPENLQELSEYTTKHLSDLEKRIVEDYLFIDEGTAENIGLPNLPENHFWVRKNGVIVGVNIDYIKNDYDHFVKELEKDFNNFHDITFKKIKETVLKYYNSFFEQLKIDFKEQALIEIKKVISTGDTKKEEVIKTGNDKKQEIIDETNNQLNILAGVGLALKPKQVSDIEFLKRVNAKLNEVYEVLGYYKFNDGVVHKRVISTTDDGSGVQLNNGLWANLIKEQSAPLFYETFLNKTRGFVAHRGLSQIAPENTLPAYQKAYDNNITIWETDLEITKDGYWVLMHDDTVDRTTNGTGRVDSLTLEQIKQLSIDGGANATTIYDGTKVPTFEEWLSLAKRLNCYPFVELKRLGATEEEVKSIVDIVKKYNMEERTAFISFGSDVLEKVRKFSFKIQLWWIADDVTQDTINWCKRIGNAHLDPYWETITKEKVALANSQGVNIAVWTVNNVEYAHKLFDMGVSLVAGDWVGEVY